MVDDEASQRVLLVDGIHGDAVETVHGLGYRLRTLSA
jgi:hypothetical protein